MLLHDVFCRGKSTSLEIFDTNLESLDLVSLTTISNGNIVVANNSRLCFAEGLNWTRLAGGQKPKIVIRYNKNTTECGGILLRCSVFDYIRIIWCCINSEMIQVKGKLMTEPVLEKKNQFEKWTFIWVEIVVKWFCLVFAVVFLCSIGWQQLFFGMFW